MMGKPYRPSNGTEGEWFMGQFCYKCARCPDEDDEAPCEILGWTFAVGVDDPNYPREWIIDERGPRCTAFAIGPDAPLPLDPDAVVRPLL